MTRYILLFLIFLYSFSNGFSTEPIVEQTVRKGTVSCAGKGMADVLVTDGVNFCKTDGKGNYSLKVDPSSAFVYISSPAGHTVPVENSVPQFYKNLNLGNRSGKFNFQLEENSTDENKHGFIAWADPQIKANEELPLYKEAVADLRDLLKSNQSIPFHAIGCGDIVGDNPSLFDSTKLILSKTGIPFYQSMGNHDMKYYGRSNETAPVIFEKHFGPAYYSFNKGKITDNVWNWDSQWKVYWYENDQRMGEMEVYSGLDPETVKSFSDKDKLAYKWISARKNNHMFRARQTSATARISVEAVDRFGKKYRFDL